MYSCRATEWPFWFGLILPFSIIYVFNWIIFIVIMFQLLRRRSDNKTDRKNMGRVFKRNALIAVGLSLLFGLGWGFGLTATSSDVKEVTFAFQLLFSVFVGSQGVLIFIFHGIRSPHFRQVWAIALGLRHKRKGFSSTASQKCNKGRVWPVFSVYHDCIRKTTVKIPAKGALILFIGACGECG